MPARFQAIALTIAALLAWGMAISTFWVNLKDGDPAVITGMATTASLLAFVAWQRHDRRERAERREDVLLDTVETFTRPAVAIHVTGPQQAIRRVK